VHRESGQASLESIALTTLVVVLLTSAAAMGAKPDLGDPVVHQFKRGLCIVRAGDCERDRAPCVTKSYDNTTRGHTTVGFVRLDNELGILIEELSDGLVRLTEIHGSSIGLEAGLGWNADLDFGKVAFGIGGELRAAVLANARAGGTVVLPSRKAADQLEKWLTDPAELIRRPPLNWIRDPRKILKGEMPSLEKDGPRVSSVYGEAGVTATLGATGVIDPVLQGDVTLRSEDAFGVRKDMKNDHRTFYYKRSAGFDAALGVGPDGIREVAGLGLRESTIYGIEFDREGKPVDFSVSSIAPLRNAGDLPEELRASASSLLRGQGERVLATERHLDLTIPGNLQAVKDFMRVIAIKRAVFGAVAPVVAELRGRLAEATYDARSYAVDSKHKGGSGEVAVGAKIGLGIEEETNTAKLLAALRRGESGQWSSDTFCPTS
jgi:hypothetical protein